MHCLGDPLRGLRPGPTHPHRGSGCRARRQGPRNLGTGRYSTTEKDITLDVTLRIGQYIEENPPDVEVIYTRKDDEFSWAT